MLCLKWKGMLEWGKAGIIIGLNAIAAVAQAGQFHVGACHDSCQKVCAACIDICVGGGLARTWVRQHCIDSVSKNPGKKRSAWFASNAEERLALDTSLMLLWQATSAFCGAILAVKAQTCLLPSRGGVDASPMRHSHSSTHSSAICCLARCDPASMLPRQLSLGHFDRFSVPSSATSTTSAAPGHTLGTSALCFPGDSALAPIP